MDQLTDLCTRWSYIISSWPSLLHFSSFRSEILAPVPCWTVQIVRAYLKVLAHYIGLSPILDAFIWSGNAFSCRVVAVRKCVVILWINKLILSSKLRRTSVHFAASAVHSRWHSCTVSSYIEAGPLIVEEYLETTGNDERSRQYFCSCRRCFCKRIKVVAVFLPTHLVSIAKQHTSSLTIATHHSSAINHYHFFFQYYRWL